MKGKKLVIAVILALIVCLVLIPTCAFADSETPEQQGQQQDQQQGQQQDQQQDQQQNQLLGGAGNGAGNGTGSGTEAETKLWTVEGGESYDSLQEAVDSGDDVTIKLNKTATGDGLFIKGIEGEAGKKVTINFGGNTYTVNTNKGSTGTESQAFHLEKGNTVTLMNGTLTSDPANTDIKVLIQNYCDLTLYNMTIDGTQLNGAGTGRYVVSNNNGSLNVTGNTSIVAKEGDYAVDAYYWPNNGYKDGVDITIDTTGTITGDIEYTRDNGTYNEGTSLNTITIKSGTLNGNIKVQDNLNDVAKKNITVTGGTFTDSNVKNYVADGYVVTENNGEYTVSKYVEPAPVVVPEQSTTKKTDTIVEAKSENAAEQTNVAVEGTTAKITVTDDKGEVIAPQEVTIKSVTALESTGATEASIQLDTKLVLDLDVATIKSASTSDVVTVTNEDSVITVKSGDTALVSVDVKAVVSETEQTVTVKFSENTVKVVCGDTAYSIDLSELGDVGTLTLKLENGVLKVYDKDGNLLKEIEKA